MIKFVLILTSVVSLNFAVSFNEVGLLGSQEAIQLIFSEKIIAVESGQPVYPIDTKVWVSNNDETISQVKLVVNEEEAILKSNDMIDLSNIMELKSGTYTLIVKGKDERTFGFTIE